MNDNNMFIVNINTYQKCIIKNIRRYYIWVKVFKNGLSKICGRQSLKI